MVAGDTEQGLSRAQGQSRASSLGLGSQVGNHCHPTTHIVRSHPRCHWGLHWVVPSQACSSPSHFSEEKELLKPEDLEVGGKQESLVKVVCCFQLFLV